VISRGGDGVWPIIAIDGGAGTGKTTSAARVADRLGFCYIDSGAVYRAIALAMRESGEEDPMSPRVPAAVGALPLRIEPTPRAFRVFLGDRELGLEIRSPEISRLSSQLSVRPEVRDKVSLLLRAAARLGPLVVEGRDIGTVVFPRATLKVFLAAELPVRAERRRLDLLRQGREQSVDEVARELAERDERDSNRETAPLRPAGGALIIDTSKIDVEQQVSAILEGYRRAIGHADA
jgi:cytidylate kinase